MKAVVVLGLTSLLCLCFQHSLAGKVVCYHGGQWSKTKPFFNVVDLIAATVPCRYKMANIQCGGDPAVIYGDNTMDTFHDKVAYMTGVTVNVTTTNDDDTVTYQILTITNATLKKYKDEGDFGKSPWTWRYAGSEVDVSKKLVGHYDQNTGLAVLVNGRMTITFRYIPPGKPRNRRKTYGLPILTITCNDRKFKALESFPETLCGSLNNTSADQNTVDWQIVPKGDIHHYTFQFHIMDNYIVLANQNVQQPDPLCQEASRIVTSGTCKNVRDKMYVCDSVFARLSTTYYAPQCDNYPASPDMFKVFVACMRVLCGTEGATSEDTCQILQLMYDKCGDVGHKKLSDILAQANCTTTIPTTEAAPTRRTQPNIDGKYSWSCTARDRKNVDGQLQPNYVTLFNRMDYRLDSVPCSYKMANVRCDGSQIEVDADYSLDVDGLMYIRGVTVTIGTTNQDGTVVYQTNKLTLTKLKKYVETGDFKKRLWRWNYTGSVKPKRKERIQGQYNQPTKSGDITYRGLSVKYFYIDPHSSNRSAGDALKIQCDAEDFWSYGRIPDSVCGGVSDVISGSYDKFYEIDWSAIRRELDVDAHHSVHKESFMLSRQNVPQRNPQCHETAEIFQSRECEDLGGKMYRCYSMNEHYQWGRYTSYRSCMKKSKIDTFKVYVACLRVLCGTRRARRADTCRVLQQVADACGGANTEWMHVSIGELLSGANCTSSN